MVGDWRAPAISGVLLLGVGALYLWLRPRLAQKRGSIGSLRPGRYEDPPPIERARAGALRSVTPSAGFTKIRQR